MALQQSLPSPARKAGAERRFLSLFLPNWPTDYLKRREPELTAPIALYEKIKGGLRLAAIDAQAFKEGLRVGQSVADARALVPKLTVKELDRALLETAFADFADWHSNASPLVAALTETAPYGDLMLDITGVSHLFGGEEAMLDMLLDRLQLLNYTVSGAIAPTIGAAWAASRFAQNQVVTSKAMTALLDGLPLAGLRLDAKQIAALTQMGLTTIGQLRSRPRKPMQARFGASFLIRLDQTYGQIEERMTPRLPAVDQFVEHRFFEPISLLEDVLLITAELALKLSAALEKQGLGAQTFHLFLYRVDHKVMPLSLNASRLTRDPQHIASLFRNRAKMLESEDYDPGFGIDMVRLAASSLDTLEATQTGAFETENGAEDIDRLADRLGSRLGAMAVGKIDLIQAHLPENSAQLIPALIAEARPLINWPRQKRPLRLLPVPELVRINAEVPNGLPASMIWRRQQYRLVKGVGPERIGTQWHSTAERLELVEPPEQAQAGESLKRLPYEANLPLHDPDGGTHDYYLVEDMEGLRFWVFREGLYGGEKPVAWYVHGFFP